MGYGLRWFIAEDDGTVTRVPAATCERWFDGEALPAARAGRDLKLLEVVVDVDRHHVVGVLRILPFRQGVRCRISRRICRWHGPSRGAGLVADQTSGIPSTGLCTPDVR